MEKKEKIKENTKELVFLPFYISFHKSTNQTKCKRLQQMPALCELDIELKKMRVYVYMCVCLYNYIPERCRAQHQFA